MRLRILIGGADARFRNAAWRDRLMPGRTRRPRSLFALGYGANGITFGAVAAHILRDVCTERENDDATLFRFDRQH
ncbi:MAG: hypothetical protein Q8Q14_14990 [Gemmatimonadales bacterium]|nr:hypothetical protein [Gemmatimonadales bacterium]